MSSFYNSNVSDEVGDGGSSTHTTPENIQVIDGSAEIRWKGIESTETTSTNYTKSNEDEITVSSTGTHSVSTTIPSADTDGFNELFVSGGISLNTPDNASGTIELDTSWTTKSTSYNGSDDDLSDYSHDESYTGNQVTTTITLDSLSGDLDLYINSSYSGYNTSTSTYDTTNPTVFGDWSAEYDGTIDDGYWSSWQPLDGVSEGVNDFTHSIGGSNKAKFEFRYEYKPSTPTAVDVLRVTISGVTYDVALADPTDESLEYTNVKVQSSNQTLCLDVVDPNQEDAIDAFIQTPVGKLALRENST